MRLRILTAIIMIAFAGCADFNVTPSMDVIPGDATLQDNPQQEGVAMDSVDMDQVVRDTGPRQDTIADIYKDKIQKDKIQPKDVYKDSYKEIYYDVIRPDAEVVNDVITDIGPPPDIFYDIYNDTTDIPTYDSWVDATPVPTYKIFRMTSLNVEEPGFQYCQDMGPCMDITTTVNQMINQYIKGQIGTQPLDILVEFARSPSDYEVTIGNGTCVRQGSKIIGCDFMAGGNQVTYNDVVFKGPQFSSLCLNDPQVIPTCFGTDQQDASIAIPGMQMVLGLRDANVAAHFTGASPFVGSNMQGYLLGFMPFKWAQAIAIDYPGYFNGTMDQLLPQDKIESYKGEKGWWFTFSFNAKPVPPSPYSF